MKKCPYCAEEIQDDALVCRFCGKTYNYSMTGQFQGVVDANPPQQPSLRLPVWSLVMALLALPSFLISFLLTFIFIESMDLSFIDLPSPWQNIVVTFIGSFFIDLFNIPLMLSLFFSIRTLVRNHRLNSNRGNIPALIALVISISAILVTFLWLLQVEG